MMQDKHGVRWNLQSRPMTEVESTETSDRVEAATRKRELGKNLTDEEWMLVQYASHTCGCHACGAMRRAG